MSPVIQTTRFNKVEIEPSHVISFPQGLIGFEGFKEFILIDKADKDLFLWLQSVQNPNLCFLVVEPTQVVDFFSPKLTAENAPLLDSFDDKTQVFLSLVTVSESYDPISVNLKSPVVIDTKKRLGFQIILDEKYSIQHVIKETLKNGKDKLKKSQSSIVTVGS